MLDQLTVRRLSLLAILPALGCGRFGFDSRFDNALVVDVAAERLAGPATMASIDDLDPGTEGLSLLEALTIAANSEGTDRITFAPAVFRDGVAIALSAPLPAITGAGTELDGTGATVVIDASAAGAEAILEIAADDASLRRLRFVGTTGAAVSVGAVARAQLVDLAFDAPAGPAVLATGAGELRISGAAVTAPAGDAVVIDGGAQIEVIDSSFSDIGGRAVAASNATGVAVRDSRFERGVSEMVDVADSAEIEVAGNFMVLGDKATDRGVRFVRVDRGRIGDNIIDPGTAQLINLTDAANIAVEHNILDRGDAGVVIEGASRNITVFGNVIIESSYDGVYIAAEATGTTVVHNTLYRCTTPIVDGAADTTTGNNLIADDGFIDPASYDFRLVDGSPAIDAGDDLGYDCVAGEPERYWGAGPDLGAVETR